MDISAFCKTLNDFLDSSGVSQNSLAKRAAVPQSQISDWSKGRLKRFGKNPKKVMRVIDSYRELNMEPIPDSVLVAVRDFCGGNPDRANTLVKVINAMQALD